jgi:hypothetical protein
VSTPPSEPPEGEPPPREALALIHHHPGRLRVRAEAFRAGDAADRVRAALDAEPGITAILHNPKTGSLLVEYQPGHADPEELLRCIAEAADLDMPTDERPRGKEPALVAIDTTRELNELVHELTGQRADLRTLVPAGMAALAVYSFAVQGDRLPRWDNLLYWSYNIFSQLHRREIDASAAAREAAEVAASRVHDSGPAPKPTAP